MDINLDASLREIISSAVAITLSDTFTVDQSHADTSSVWHISVRFRTLFKQFYFKE